jgi:hypothetical protein
MKASYHIRFLFAMRKSSAARTHSCRRAEAFADVHCLKRLAADGLSLKKISRVDFCKVSTAVDSLRSKKATLAPQRGSAPSMDDRFC